MVTKIFLANLVAVLAAGQIDKHIFQSAIGDHRWLVYPFGLWAVISFISIPAWLIYLILTY